MNCLSRADLGPCPKCGKLLRQSWDFNAKGKQVPAVLCISFGGDCDYKLLGAPHDFDYSLLDAPHDLLAHDRRTLATITAKLSEALGDRECEGCNGDKTFDAGKDRPRINCSQCRGTGRISAAEGLSLEQMVDAVVEKLSELHDCPVCHRRCKECDCMEKRIAELEQDNAELLRILNRCILYSVDMQEKTAESQCKEVCEADPRKADEFVANKVSDYLARIAELER